MNERTDDAGGWALSARKKRRERKDLVDLFARLLLPSSGTSGRLVARVLCVQRVYRSVTQGEPPARSVGWSMGCYSLACYVARWWPATNIAL